jgi:hypothetical protein
MKFREFLDHLGIVLLVIVLAALVVLFLKANTADEQPLAPPVQPEWEIDLR